MISKITVLCFLALAGCSGGNGEVFAGDDTPVIFRPDEKPRNPASSQTLQVLFGDLKKAKEFIPEDAAFFNSIILGDRLRPIYDGSFDRKMSLNKLSFRGREYLKRIQASCQINPATKQESGRPKPGATVTSVLQMSARGDKCEYKIEKSLNQSRFFSDYVSDSESSSWTETFSLSVEESRDVNNADIQAVSNIRALHFSNRIAGKVRTTASHEGFKSNALLKGAGTAQVSFADGTELKGPVNSETTTIDGKTTVKVRFNGTTKSGDILILVIRDDVSVLNVYVNGEPASSNVLDAFGLDLMEVATHRY